ncbi:MAG: GHKL domain-containing protein [Chitinophagaceae bacterium]|jgi:signal transduction histidine kinase|nr:MAG: GHKL domain-containing protein [Chitinophagaceae bacterium]
MPLSKATIRWGYFIAFLLLLLSYFLIFFSINKQMSEARQLNHSYSVVNNLEMVRSTVTDAETNVRGYILYKDERFLQAYNSGSKNVLILLDGLRGFTPANKSYKEELDTLQRLINRKLYYLTATVNSFQRSGFEINASILNDRDTIRSNMDSIRQLISRVKREELVFREEKNSRLEGFFAGTEIISLTSLVIVLVTIFYSLFIYNRGNKEKEASDNKVKRYSLELEERVKELKQVNTELEELRSVEKFTSTGRIARTIAHEVRNPLTNISLATEQLKDLNHSNQEAEMLLEMVGRNVTRINQLVSDLLNSTRFAQLEYSSADINEVLDETLELAKDRIELSKIKVEKNYATDICEIMVDKEKIKLAFLNIIVNAIEAMPQEEGVLQITTSKSGERCIVEIKDNGSGMDEDTLQKLFDPYFTGKAKGNGLGLTNTQNIILNHKGSITVTSQKANGSVFIVTLSTKREVLA